MIIAADVAGLFIMLPAAEQSFLQPRTSPHITIRTLSSPKVEQFT